MQKVVSWGSFPSPAGCLRANVNDGTYVRRRSEVPVIVHSDKDVWIHSADFSHKTKELSIVHRCREGLFCNN